MVCQNLNSTYAYDFPEIFNNVLAESAPKGASGRFTHNGVMPADDGGGGTGPGLRRLVELVLEPPAPGTALLPPGHNAAGKLVEVTRAAGQNDVGMVCWRVTLATEEYPAGRDVILVANDITHMSGSLSPKEDAVYRAAFDLAVAEGLPCVYISANSGARIGLDEAVKAAFKVAWQDPLKPAKGFKYLYLTEDDFEMLGANGRVVAERKEGRCRLTLSNPS